MLKKIPANSHPIWLIEEKTKIFRREVWFNPPILPINEVIKINPIIKLGVIECEITINGANFCQVNRVKVFIQFNPSIKFGSQKCKGAAPNFKHMAVLITVISFK